MKEIVLQNKEMLSVAADEIEYSFTRAVSAPFNVEGYGLLHDCKLFKLYANDDLAGQFFYHRRVCFISYDEFDLKIEIKTHFFKKSDYIIIDRTTEEKIGEYFLPNWTGPGLGKIGSISIGYETYDCTSVMPDNRAKLFDPSTWGNHKMILGNDITSVVYRGQEGKTIKHFAEKSVSSMSGTIVVSNATILLVLAGLYMLEQGIDKQEMVAN